MELLLGDYDVYTKRLEELTEKIEVKLEEIPYVDKLLEIKGVGKKIVSGLIAEIGDITGVYLGNVKIIAALRAILINKFKFAELTQKSSKEQCH